MAHYKIFLLTVRLDADTQSNAETTGYFVLEDPRTGERRKFVNAHELAAALQGTVAMQTERSHNTLSPASAGEAIRIAQKNSKKEDD